MISHFIIIHHVLTDLLDSRLVHAKTEARVKKVRECMKSSFLMGVRVAYKDTESHVLRESLIEDSILSKGDCQDE